MMLMWTLIIGGMALATIAIIIYLITRVMKFGFLKRRLGTGKLRRFLVSAVIVLLCVAAMWRFLDVINTSICLVHLGVIWILCDLAAYLIRRRRKTRDHSGEPEGTTRDYSGEPEGTTQDYSGEPEGTARDHSEEPEGTTRDHSGEPKGTPRNYSAKPERYVAGICALVITVLYMGYGWYSAHHVWQKTYTLSTTKKAGNIRVIGFADSHNGTTFHGEGFLKQVEAMQACNPDVVLIAGDYVDDDTSREDMIACCAALGTLKTTYGVYYVFGNHDRGYYNNEHRGYNSDDLVRELEANNVTVLEDEAVLLDDRFYVIGRKDRSEEQIGRGRKTMQELLDGLDTDKYMIVADHQPYDYEAQEKSGVDLVFSGHTHGGQFIPINYLGEWTGLNAKTYGLSRRGNTDFIVTSGISDWAIKFKTGCRSEFVIMDIQGE